MVEVDQRALVRDLDDGHHLPLPCLQLRPDLHALGKLLLRDQLHLLRVILAVAVRRGDRDGLGLAGGLQPS